MYRDYLSECLRVLTKSNACIAGEGAYMTAKYREIINPETEETRDPEEIKVNLLAKLRGGAA